MIDHSLVIFCLCMMFLCAMSCNRASKRSDELLFWSSNNNQEIILCDSVTSRWNRQHPGTPVHMQPIPEGQSSEEVILAAVVGKTTPDIYANMWQGNVEMYAKAHVLVALDTLEGFMDFLRERCDSNVINEITSTDGHIYQVPWKVNPIMTIYNKNIFEKNKLGEPATYSQYLAAAETIKQTAKKQGINRRFGYTAVKPIWYEMRFNFYPLYLAASGGGHLIKDGQAAFDNKYAVGVFNFLQQLYRNDYFSKESATASEDIFVTQKITTKWTGPWEIPYLTKIPSLAFDFDYYHEITPDDHDGPVYTYADPKNIVIFSTCANPQLAWSFVRTIVDREGDLELLKVTGQLPRRKDLMNDTGFATFVASHPRMKPFFDQLPYVKGDDNSDKIVEALDILSQEYEACVIYGRKDPATAVHDAAVAVNLLLGNRQAAALKN